MTTPQKDTDQYPHPEWEDADPRDPRALNPHGPRTMKYWQWEAERAKAELARVKDTKHEEMVGLNIRVPRRLRDQARDLAHQRDIAMREVVTEALEEYLRDQR